MNCGQLSHINSHSLLLGLLQFIFHPFCSYDSYCAILDYASDGHNYKLRVAQHVFALSHPLSSINGLSHVDCFQIASLFI